MTVRDKIAAGDYESKIPRELPPDDIDEEMVTAAEYKRLVNTRAERERRHRELYRQDCHRLEGAVFKADLEAEYELVGHPKADKVFGLAWEHGHSASLHEVWMYYDDFAELVK